MQWRPITHIIPDLSGPPYLLPDKTRPEVENRATSHGFEVRHVDAAGFDSERAASLAIGRQLEFPNYFRGGWDGFFDLLSAEFQEKPRRLIVGLLNADVISGRDLRLFVNTSWHLRDASETIESDGGGDWQLEFLYWGAWPPVGG
ncbi:barstar family protein [Streptomyces monomycini]|uniref:barstar family protein n=1 Tax=Streptomyces monomycini TaxID=371720 RepID=UPI0004AA978B|nr:barstar family protein [Streptomyces monomycini]